MTQPLLTSTPFTQTLQWCVGGVLLCLLVVAYAAQDSSETPESPDVFSGDAEMLDPKQAAHDNEPIANAQEEPEDLAAPDESHEEEFADEPTDVTDQDAPADAWTATSDEPTEEEAIGNGASCLIALTRVRLQKLKSKLPNLALLLPNKPLPPS